MKCTRCGTEYEGTFCPQCGAPNPENQPPAYQPPPMEEPPKTKKLKWWHILLIILGVLIVLGIIGNIFGGGGKDSSSSTGKTASDKPSLSSTLPSQQPEASTPPEESSEQPPAPSEEPSSAAPQATVYKEGMYKVGADIPAGVYGVFPTSDIMGYYAITSDSTGDLESILNNDNFDGRRYVELEEGQYFTLQRGEMRPFEEVSPEKAKDNILPAGMYKVGFDIQPGEYKVIADPDSTLAYLCVYSDLSGSLENIVTNDNFTGEKYITVTEGQYLLVTRGTIQVS